MYFLLTWKAENTCESPGGLIMKEWTDANSYLMSYIIIHLVCIHWKRTSVQCYTVWNSPADQ